MENELIVPIHRAIDREHILGRMRQAGPKGLDFDKAEEMGVISRISNLLCAMHLLTMAAHTLFGEVEVWFDACNANRHEIKKACQDFGKAYDRWFKFWRGYQTVDGVLEMNSETADLVEQFMRWSQLPVRWEVGQPQDAPREHEPMIEIDREDRIWRVYRDVAENDTTADEQEEWAVMRSDQPNGRSTMTCVERGMDRSSAQMSAKRMSANDPGRLYTASKLESIVEKRLEVIPYKAFLDGDMIGDVKSVIKDKR